LNPNKEENFLNIVKQAKTDKSGLTTGMVLHIYLTAEGFNISKSSFPNIQGIIGRENIVLTRLTLHSRIKSTTVLLKLPN